MPRGTVIDVPGNCVVEARPLADALERSSGPLALWLGVPVAQEGTPLVAGTENRCGRVHVRTRPRLDENSMDPDSEARLEFRYLNGRLFLGDEDRSGHETLKLAEIARKGKHDLDPIVSDTYIPPLTDVTVSDTLNAMLDRVCRTLRDTNRALGHDVASRHHTLALERATNPEAVFKLNATNTHMATVEQLCRTKGVHPFDTYRTLCALAGSLALFTPERCCPDFPDYDHERIGPCFRWLSDKIIEFLEYTWSRTWDMVDFEPIDPRRLDCELPTGWLDRGRELFVGVGADGDERKNLDRLLDGSLKLIGEEDLAVVHHAAVPGITLARCPATPPRLPELTDVVFYRVDREATPHPRWKSLERSRHACLISEGQDLSPYTVGLYVTFENPS